MALVGAGVLNKLPGTDRLPVTATNPLGTVAA